VIAPDIHVWTLHLPNVEATTLEPLLSPDERERASRYRFDHLRQSFVVTRAALRCLLARYFGGDPAAIRFDYGAKGKPALAGGGIEFSTTHSGDMAAFAIAKGCPVGIDLERIRPVSHMEEIARRFFYASEYTELMSQPPAGRDAAFFRCWTRKEACVKVTGEGLSGLLDVPQCSVQDLSLAPGYAAALAASSVALPRVLVRLLELP
jgi:4'-phosphopantetheinyl transferase